MASLEHGRVPSPRPIAVKEIPLVDRTEEMDILKEAVYRAVHGEGGLVFIHGEAGIGKTRLVRELGAYARSRGVQVLYGRCPALFRMDGVPPYILWKEVIKNYLETCTLDQLDKVIGSYPAEVAKLVPELSQKLKTMPQSFQISPEQEQNRLFEAVSQFVTNISQEAPLLVILDDLQWTDPSSLLLLHYLARGVQKTSLLLLGAYRSTDIDDRHPLTAVLTELNRERLPQEIQLKRMSASDVSEMIKNILEQEDVSEEFCRLVYEKTRGNPFFAEEVIKSLKEEDAIYPEEGRWKFKEISAIEFPKSVKNIVKARFSRLDDEYQSILTFASFVGNDFTLEAMSALSSIEENKLLDIMDGLLRAGFIKHSVIRGEDICSFADIIVRDVVYEEVGPFKRKKLHAVVGSVLERVYAKSIDEHLGELASHFLESGDKEKALDYFLKAGEKSRKIYANTEAASYFEAALRLLQEKEGELQEKGHVLETLGDIRNLVGELDEGTRHWNEALLLWDQLNEKEKAARLHRKIANLLWNSKGDTAKAEEHYNKALRTLENEPESHELASLYEDMAHMYYRTKDTTKAQSLAERALELGKKLNDCEAIANSYVSLGTIFNMTGQHKEAIEHIEKGLKLALDNGLTEAALRAYNNLSATLPIQESERGRESIEEGYALAKKIGHIQLQSFMGTNIAWYHFGIGDLKKALSLVKESVALDRKIGDMVNLSFSVGTLALASLVLGDSDECEKLLKEKISITEKLNDTSQVANSYSWLGWVHFDKGEYSKAKALYEKSCEVTEKAGAKSFHMWMSSHVVWAYVELGELEKASSLLDKICDFASQVKDIELIAWTNARKGMMLRAQKKWEDSIQHFERSIQELEALGYRRYNVWVFALMFLLEYARVYSERDQPGDREKALNLLNQALEIFQKMGAKRYIERVEARMAFIETGKVTSSLKPTDYVSTGHTDLDKLLYGGLPPNYAVVLTSPSCDERDSLITSFLETGVENGEATFHVTINANLAKTLTGKSMPNMQLFVCNPEAEAIAKSSPNMHTLRGVENLTDISIALTSAIRELDPSMKSARRVCLGLVSDVLLQHHAVETRRWLTALMTKLKSEGFTTLAVMNPQMHPSQEAQAILDLFDGEINIYEKETDKGSERFLKIKRMSNQKYLENEIALAKV